MLGRHGSERILQTLAGLTIVAGVSCGPKDHSSKPSPDQPAIDAFVFVSDRDDAEGEVYYEKFGTTGAIRLTSYAGIDAAPVLSPSGTKVAFHKAISNITWEVYVALVDGSALVKVTNDPSTFFRYPDWNPDDKTIVMEGAIPTSPNINPPGPKPNVR